VVLKSIQWLLLLGIMEAYGQHNIPITYNNSAWSLPSYLQHNYLLNEGYMEKQGSKTDSMVFITKGKVSSCYVWHYNEQGKITYAAVYMKNLTQPIYTKKATYDAQGNMTEYLHLNTMQIPVEKRNYTYDATNRVISFQQFNDIHSPPQIHLSVSYESNSQFTIIQHTPPTFDEVWMWKYYMGKHNNVVAVEYLDSNAMVLHRKSIENTGKQSSLCKDSIVKKMVKTIKSNQHGEHYRVEKTYIDQYQPEILIPVNMANEPDNQSMEVIWVIKKADVLIDEKIFDPNDTLIEHTKYYNEWTIQLKSASMKPDRTVYKTVEKYNQQGILVDYLTYFNGGHEHLQSFYQADGKLERKDIYVNKKLRYAIFYFSS
jgi:hypothetical protein